MPQQDWKLRYAPHIGFPGRDSPYFLETVGSLDAVDHIDHIASLGFAGIADKDLVLRPPMEQSAIGEALARNGLEMGAFVDQPQPPYLPWASRDPNDVALLRAALRRCIEASQRVGGGIACLTPANDRRIPLVEQLRALSANLRWAGDMAEKAGVSIAIEPISKARVPDALLRRVDEANEVLPASAVVGIILDTLHLTLESDNLLDSFERASPRTVLVQIADTDRKEPGSGSIDFMSFLRAVRTSGFAGLVELEHVHSRPGREGEEASLAALRKIDAAL